MELPKFEKLGNIIPIPAVNFKIIENKDLQAIASLDFGDFVIRGFRINKSKFIDPADPNSQPLWIVPPSYKDNNGNYHPIFFMPDLSLWKEVETLIIACYRETLTKHYEKKFGISPPDLRV